LNRDDVGDSAENGDGVGEGGKTVDGIAISRR